MSTEVKEVGKIAENASIEASDNHIPTEEIKKENITQKVTGTNITGETVTQKTIIQEKMIQTVTKQEKVTEKVTHQFAKEIKQEDTTQKKIQNTIHENVQNNDSLKNEQNNNKRDNQTSEDTKMKINKEGELTDKQGTMKKTNTNETTASANETYSYKDAKRSMLTKEMRSGYNPDLNVICGPLLRYTGMTDGLKHWRGSIMIVVDNDPESLKSTDKSKPVDPPTLFLQTSNSEQTYSDSYEFIAEEFHHENSISFWRFILTINMHPTDQLKATYNINNNSYDLSFYIPSQEQTMRVMFQSCNGFSLGADLNKFPGSLWDDVLRSHSKSPFHVMIGGGDQIYCDIVKLKCKSFKNWVNENNLIKKRHMLLTKEAENDLENFYFNHYVRWYGEGYFQSPLGETLQPNFPYACATIPQINVLDDHDIIDGFGSYIEHTMQSPMFKGLGNVSFKYYLLFQHHSTIYDTEEKEPSWILGHGPGPSITTQSRSIYMRLGKNMAFLGIDCRVERTFMRIVSKETYEVIFARVEKEIAKDVDKDIKQFIVLLGVPILYPRLVWLERILCSAALAPLRMWAKITSPGLLNQFDYKVEIVDDLNDHWCAETHKRERNKLMRRLIRLAKQRTVRITILSGDVHLAAMGQLQTRQRKVRTYKNIEHVHDPCYMLNVISSAITNAPPSNTLAKILKMRNHSHYLGLSCEEHMVKMFFYDVNGKKRKNTVLLPRRNWCSIDYIDHRVDVPDGLENRSEKRLLFGKNIEENVLLQDEDISTLPYKVLRDDSLIVSLNVELNVNDVTGETVPYRIIVPPLIPNEAIYSQSHGDLAPNQSKDDIHSQNLNPDFSSEIYS